MAIKNPFDLNQKAMTPRVLKASPCERIRSKSNPQFTICIQTRQTSTKLCMWFYLAFPWRPHQHGECLHACVSHVVLGLQWRRETLVMSRMTCWQLRHFPCEVSSGRLLRRFHLNMHSSLKLSIRHLLKDKRNI